MAVSESECRQYFLMTADHLRRTNFSIRHGTGYANPLYEQLIIHRNSIPHWLFVRLVGVYGQNSGGVRQERLTLRA
jgi:hypothetical protein